MANYDSHIQYNPTVNYLFSFPSTYGFVCYKYVRQLSYFLIFYPVKEVTDIPEILFAQESKMLRQICYRKDFGT